MKLYILHLARPEHKKSREEIKFYLLILNLLFLLLQDVGPSNNLETVMASSNIANSITFQLCFYSTRQKEYCYGSGTK